MERTRDRLFFHAGPFVILVSFYLLFYGYKPLWENYSGSDAPGINNGLAAFTVIVVYGFARYFERVFSASFESRSWITTILAGFIGLILLALSSLGVSNALYYSVAGRHVIENGVNKLTTHYDLLVADTAQLTITPVLEGLSKRIEAPLATLQSEIISTNCGIGSGARQAIAAIQRELGPTFTPLNFNRAPRCDDKPALTQMAEQYHSYVRQQLLAVPSVINEKGPEKVALLAFVTQRHDEFRKRAGNLIVLANESARAVRFFGSRDGFNTPVRLFVALNETLVLDRSTAAERANRFNGKYSKQTMEAIDIEQEKSLGNFWSLYLAMINLNPSYVVGFVLIAVLLDIVLVAWFHFTRTRIFAKRATVLIGAASDRVRYLWTPPAMQQ